MCHAVRREKGNEGAFLVSLCDEVGGEAICARTDSWGRTGDLRAVETVWIENNCCTKFPRESTRGLPSCRASPAELQLPRASEIVISTESRENVLLKLIIKISFFSLQPGRE